MNRVSSSTVAAEQPPSKLPHQGNPFGGVFNISNLKWGFTVKHEKFPPSYIQDAKNFSVVKPLNSGEARASPASPVPRPLTIQKQGKFDCNATEYVLTYLRKK